MLKLADDFYITSIEKELFCVESCFLTRTRTYNFRYKNYKIELSIGFSIKGYTKEDNIAIINFGYDLNIIKWSDRAQRFQRIIGLNTQNGKSTKQYFDSKEARAIVLKIIQKNLDKYLRSTNAAIISRGAFNDTQLNLPRYKQLDDIFFRYGYFKKEFDVSKMKSLYEIVGGPKHKDDRVMWLYTKKPLFFQQLEHVVD